MNNQKLFQLNDKYYTTTDLETFDSVIDNYFDEGVIEELEQYNLKRMEEEDYLLLEENKYLELHENPLNERENQILWEEDIEYLLDSEDKVGYDLNNEEDREKLQKKIEQEVRESQVDFISEEVYFEDDKNNESYSFSSTYRAEREEDNFNEFNSFFERTELEYEHDVSSIMRDEFIADIQLRYDVLIDIRNMSSKGFYDSKEEKIYINSDNGYTTNKTMMKIILHELSFEKEKIPQKDILEELGFDRMIQDEEDRISYTKSIDDYASGIENEEYEMY